MTKSKVTIRQAQIKTQTTTTNIRETTRTRTFDSGLQLVSTYRQITTTHNSQIEAA